MWLVMLFRNDLTLCEVTWSFPPALGVQDVVWQGCARTSFTGCQPSAQEMNDCSLKTSLAFYATASDRNLGSTRNKRGPTPWTKDNSSVKLMNHLAVILTTDLGCVNQSGLFHNTIYTNQVVYRTIIMEGKHMPSHPLLSYRALISSWIEEDKPLTINLSQHP